MNADQKERNFNVVAFGNRDYYQVAISLNERGQLGSLITDFYCPDSLRRVVGKRYAEELKANKTFSFYPLAALTFLFRSGKMNLLRKYLNDLFGFLAALYTYLTTNRAIVYSYYLDGFVSFYRLFGLRPQELVCFQVHPSAWYINKIVADDRLAFEKISSANFGLDIESVWSQKDFDRYMDSLSYANRVICASSITARSLFEDRSETVPYSIVPYGSKLAGRDNASFTKKPAHSERKVKLVTVCQLSQRKGLHWAFHAMKQVSAPERFEWSVVSQNIDPVIFELAPENVTFSRGLSNESLAVLMRDADLFVMPSLIEGFGLVYIEALSMGTPILYTENTGPSDFVTDGVHGFEVPVSSFVEILKIFEQIASGEINLAAMRHSCREIAHQISWQNFRSEIVSAIHVS